MATFDRFDICQAYQAVHEDWHTDAMLWERPSSRRKRESIEVQLDRIGFKVGMGWNGWDSLTENGREIYNDLCQRWNLGDGGYHDCACRDCSEIAIGWGRPLCHECQEAGCDPTGECQAPGAYGGEEEEEETE